jgi:hypothetical protein
LITRTRSPTSWNSTFSRASESASSLMSARSTRQSGLCAAIAMPMQPEPRAQVERAFDRAFVEPRHEAGLDEFRDRRARHQRARVGLNLSPANHASPVR